MRVLSIQETFGIEHLKWENREEPSPKPNQVKIKVKACSLNYRDYLMVIGKYNPRQKLPLVPLSDGCGEVVEVGSSVQKWKVGDRVLGIFAQEWQTGDPDIDSLRSTLGGPRDGMLQEFICLPEEGVVRVPDHLTEIEAATLPCAGLTAYNAIFTQGNVKEGDTVVVLGTGGVSIFALQFAKLANARVIVTSSSNDKLLKAKQMGADEIINYNEKSNWEREIRKLTQMKGADLIVEVGGAGTLQKSMAAIRPAGTIALIGVLAGGESVLSLYPILMQGVRLQGVIVGSRANFESMNQFIEHHKMKPVVDKVYSFQDAPKAFSDLSKATHFGKICIDLSS